MKDIQNPTPGLAEDASAIQSQDQPRSFLVTFLLAMAFGILGLRHFYLGDKKLGWIRVGLLLDYAVLMIIGFAFHLGSFIILGSLSLLAASIWALVDFFYVYYAVTSDADGHPLANTQRDKKWARSLFWATIIIGVIYFIVLALVISIRESEFHYDDGSLFSEPNNSRNLDYNFENL